MARAPPAPRLIWLRLGALALLCQKSIAEIARPVELVVHHLQRLR
jgi:hypothetical protein